MTGWVVHVGALRLIAKNPANHLRSGPKNQEVVELKLHLLIGVISPQLAIYFRIYYRNPHVTLSTVWARFLHQQQYLHVNPHHGEPTVP